MENNTCLSRALCALCTYDSYVYYAILIPYIGSIQNRRQITNKLNTCSRWDGFDRTVFDDALMQKRGYDDS